jgi:glutaredoxin
MHSLMRVIRGALGKIIITLDKIIPPKVIKRDLALQRSLDVETSKMALYQYESCPFCVKTRRAIKRLSLNIEVRDALNNSDFKNELISKGGMNQVPCLKITDDKSPARWLYESSDIISYLENRFSNPIMMSAKN